MRHRRRIGVLLGVLALVGGGTAYALTRPDTSRKVDVLSPTTSAPGDLTATGRVVHVPGGGPVRFCAPVMEAFGAINGPRIAKACDLGVDVTGVDLDTLTDRYERDGAVEGYATLVGHLDGEVLVVTRQSARTPEPERENLDPPCSPPPGGWPLTDNPNTRSMTNYQFHHRDLVAQIAIIRPSAALAYPFILTWGDPEPARAELGPGVCVLQSRMTKADFDAATRDVMVPALPRANGVYSYGGYSLAPDGQLYSGVEAVRVTPGLEALVAKYPPGTVRVDYWLHPV